MQKRYDVIFDLALALVYTIRLWYFYRMHTKDSASTRFAYL